MTENDDLDPITVAGDDGEILDDTEDDDDKRLWTTDCVKCGYEGSLLTHGEAVQARQKHEQVRGEHNIVIEKSPDDDGEDDAGGEPSETRRPSSVERSESDGGHVLVRVPRRAGRRRYRCRRCKMISRHRSTFEAVACRDE
jgi:hypothetical protein